MVSSAGQQYLDDRESSYGAEAINTIKTNTPFQNLWYSRLIFDRLVIAEMQDLVDEGYRDKKERRLEGYGNSFWWSMDNEDIRMPDIRSQE